MTINYALNINQDREFYASILQRRSGDDKHICNDFIVYNKDRQLFFPHDLVTLYLLYY